MCKKNKNVRKLDNIILSAKQLFPTAKFRVRQKITSMTAKGWGFRIERTSTETNLEPTED